MSEISQNNLDEKGQMVKEYLDRAAKAGELGDAKLSLHLFLAAYGQAVEGTSSLSEDGLSALKSAWGLALEQKERSLAEYIFEKMEPALSPAEVKDCSQMLQSLMMDKLESYGFSRKDFEEVADVIAREVGDVEIAAPGADMPFTTEIVGPDMLFPNLLGNDLFEDSPRVKVTPIATVHIPAKPAEPVEAAPAPEAAAEKAATVAEAKVEATEAEVTKDQEPAAVEAAVPAAEAHATAAAEPAPVPTVPPVMPRIPLSPMAIPAPMMMNPAMGAAMASATESFSMEAEQSFKYEDLAGYANAIRDAKSMGLIREHDPRYQQLVKDLNAAHGLMEPPALDPFIVTGPVREDLSRFCYATCGELGLPVFRMYIEDNTAGMQTLCMSAQKSNEFKYDRRTCLFTGRGIVLLEDLDLWEMPSAPEGADGPMTQLMMAQMNKSFHDLRNFIRAAVENPDVVVLVSAVDEKTIIPCLYEVMAPVQRIAIDYPTAGERASIWMQLVAEHPSLSSIGVAQLVKNSARMSRYDIYTAVADVLDDTYREDLASGHASKVRAARLYERLAAYQPLDSDEYHTLEEAIVQDFRAELSHIDDLLR